VRVVVVAEDRQRLSPTHRHLSLHVKKKKRKEKIFFFAPPISLSFILLKNECLGCSFGNKKKKIRGLVEIEKFS